MSQYEGKSDIQRMADIEQHLLELQGSLDGTQLVSRGEADHLQQEILVDMFECLKNLQEKAK